MNRSFVNEDISYINKSVENHYSPGDLMGRITNALKKEGKDINSITLEDLAPVEEFHTRGREATSQLIERLKINENSNVLDLGSGIGGTSRYIASKYHCRVTGLDLSEEFITAARELTRITGLDKYVTFQKGDATRMPFENREFDIVITQHAQMNIDNKGRLVAEIYRVLNTEGYFALHDIFRNGNADPVQFPVPWAENSSISFLAEWDKYKYMLEKCGMIKEAEEDLTPISLQWFNAMSEKMARQAPSPVSLQLVMGETAPLKFRNLVAGLRENKLRIIQAVFQKL
ncbi:MAG: class I SAM-dependent methyltransferase [archaeon]